MSSNFLNLTADNIDAEHLCCAIADKKHRIGVEAKKNWLKDRLKEGHVFRKLDARGKVLIEYAPLETAWVPVVGDNYLYIYCLWVSGGFKGKGLGRELLEYCIADAKQQGKSGVCILSSKKKLSFLSDKKFMQKFGFVTVDTIDNYEIMALSFDGSKPRFAPNAKKQAIDSATLTIYYNVQCPYIPNCIEEIEDYCKESGTPVDLIKVDTLEKAKALPCLFNNWATFRNGKLETVQPFNAAQLKKMLDV